VTPDITPLASHFWQFIEHWQALIASVVVIAAAGVFAFVLHRQMRQAAATAAQEETARQQLWATIVEAADRHVVAALAPAATAYDAVLRRLAELQRRLDAAERRAADEAERTAAALVDLHGQVAAAREQSQAEAGHMPAIDPAITDQASVSANGLGEGR
jgi:uncharacterized membrane-anchored protein YhcB (DUF1043 family)